MDNKFKFRDHINYVAENAPNSYIVYPNQRK